MSTHIRETWVIYKKKMSKHYFLTLFLCFHFFNRGICQTVESSTQGENSTQVQTVTGTGNSTDLQVSTLGQQSSDPAVSTLGQQSSDPAVSTLGQQSSGPPEGLSTPVVTELPSPSNDSPVIEPPGEKWYLENSPFSIKCHYNSSTPLTEAQKTKLKFYNKDETETIDTKKGFDAPIYSMPTEKTITVELRKSMIKDRDAGKYVCKFESSSATTQADVVVVQVEKGKTEYDLEQEDKLDYTLSCKFNPLKDGDLDLSKRESSIKWSKDGVVLSGSKYNVTNHGANLTIIKAAWEDIGLYSCEYNTKLENNQPVAVASTVAFEGQPRVKKMQTSKNFVQGDPMTLKCPISGYPEPEVVWKKDGAELQKTEYIIFSSENNITNAVLKIISLDFKDKGTYSCSGNSTIGASNNAEGILIRVKDKLAALWPFLAIVAEVIILCIIIFIYEKKRSKAMEDEADGVDDNIPNADDHKGKDVRQRSVRT